jgi:hypothetical protein
MDTAHPYSAPAEGRCFRNRTRKDKTMPRIVITHAVEDVARWREFDGERATNMSAFGTEIRSYVGANGNNRVAVSMNVTDPEGLQVFLQSETCDAIMRKHGVIKPVNMFADGA